MKNSGLCLVLLMLAPLATFAQTTFQEQAARLQDINAFLLDLRPGTLPVKPDQLAFAVSLDLTPQPDVNTRVGNKEEEVDPPSVVPRLRLRIETRSGFFAGGTYVPGMELDDYEADYYGLEAGFRFRIKGFDAQIRAAMVDGDITGPITEKNVDDFFTFENRGYDLTLGRGWRAFYFYGFAGFGEAETTLDVQSDGVRLANTGEEAYGGLGAGWRRGPWELVLEQNITGDYLKHLVISAGYRF